MDPDPTGATDARRESSTERPHVPRHAARGGPRRRDDAGRYGPSHRPAARHRHPRGQLGMVELRPVSARRDARADAGRRPRRARPRCTDGLEEGLVTGHGTAVRGGERRIARLGVGAGRGELPGRGRAGRRADARRTGRAAAGLSHRTDPGRQAVPPGRGGRRGCHRAGLRGEPRHAPAGPGRFRLPARGQHRQHRLRAVRGDDGLDGPAGGLRLRRAGRRSRRGRRDGVVRRLRPRRHAGLALPGDAAPAAALRRAAPAGRQAAPPGGRRRTGRAARSLSPASLSRSRAPRSPARTTAWCRCRPDRA